MQLENRNDLGLGGEILSSRETAAGSRFSTSEPRTVTLRGTSEPVEILTVSWS